MKKRLCCSTLFSAAALSFLTFATAYGQGPVISIGSGGANGSSSYTTPARIPATYPSSNPAAGGRRAIFEGPNVTDYFNFEQNFSTPANPQIAVGPEDILMVIGRQIFRVPNGNAAGVAPASNGLPVTTNNPTPEVNPLTIGSQQAQKAFLDVWMGEDALNTLCPTTPRTNVSCLFENATTTYDQMHGRFLVLFTVTDTGLTQVSNNQGFVVTSPRKSSWVLMVSRYAILTDATDPVIASSDLFVTPTPPNDAVTGGVNANLWTMFMWGNDPKVSDPTGPGSINSLPAIEPTFTNPFDCLPTAIAAVDTMPTTVCYFPTAARLGVDNETVTIATPVYNANINPVNLDPFFQPVGGGGCLNGQAVCTPGYAGTRIRVIKKSALYTAPPGLGELVAGNQHDPLGFVNASLGQYYDLYSNTGNGVPIALAGVPPTPYTAVASAAEPLPGTLPQADPALNRLSGLFYEPAHLRGRTMATYSNSPVSFGNTGSTYLVGTVTGNSAQTTPRATVWVQGIRYSFGFTQLPTEIGRAHV